MNIKDMKINLIIAPISFSVGDAGSNRLRYLTNEIRLNTNIEITNLILSKDINSTEEVYYQDNVSYSKIINNKYWASLLNLKKIYKLLKEKKNADKNIIYYYSVNFNPFDFFFFIIAKYCGYKIIFDEVELFYTKLSKSEGSGFLKVLIISVNQYLIKFISDHTFCISTRIQNYYNLKSSILPICYDSKLLELKRNTINTSVQILYSGSFAEKDNVSSLLSVFKNLKTKGIKFNFTLSGKVPVTLVNDYNIKLQEFDLSDCVSFVGLLSLDDYQQLLVNSDICIVARTNSLFANTGFPFKLGEYLITQNAVIVSDIGDIRKYINDEDAVIITPDSQMKLEEAIEQLILDVDYRTKIAYNGKLKAMRFFNPITQAKQIINILESL